MTTMTKKDYRDILDTVYTVNCCEDRESFLDILMPSMISMFHADCVTFHLIQGYPWHIKIVESRSFKPEKHCLNEDKFYPELYKDNFYQQSPLLKKAVSSSKLILKIGESISLKEWERSDLYNNFIVPQNLYWEMFLSLRWKNNLQGMITLWRSKDQGDYAGNDVLKAEVLAPHLMVATHNVSIMSNMIKRPDNPVTTEEDNAEGLLLLDHKLKLLYFNARARQICLQINNQIQPGALDCVDGEFPVPGCIVNDCTSLLDWLKIEDHPILWPKERIISSENNLNFRVECSLIWKTDPVNSQPNFVVILKDIKAEQVPGINLQSQFNLSKRELDVIYYLNKGLSYSQIGEKLYISKLTVHTHIKNIYRKLGTKSRIELYRYIQPPN
jgi:DNA-binding CsgD family transcriptional regulator